jgi:hypothetical protein
LAKAFTARPDTATGVLPAGQPVALAMLMVGSGPADGAGKVGLGPKLASGESFEDSPQAVNKLAHKTMAEIRTTASFIEISIDALF